MGKTVLVVEDDAIQQANISAYLTRNGWEVQACGSAEEALGLFDTLHPDAVVTDQRLPRMTGVELIVKMRESDPLAKCIVMTGDDSAQTAVQAMKAGAYDYVLKPVSMAELNLLLERAVGTAKMEQVLQFHQQRQASGAGLNALIGESPAMMEMKQTIRQVLEAERRVADGDLPAVLVHGETGTGKELVARSMHFDGARAAGPFVEINCASIPSQLLEAERRVADGDLPAVLVHGETGTGKELVARSMHFDGARAAGPFVEINCASIPSQLLEAELFGHEKGAFTDAKERRTGLVEAADGGTLFLDEIGEVDLTLQAKLLKLLEEKTVRRIGAVKERKVNLRIISATNRDLAAMVKQGTFRSDLYFRLRIISVNVPALRDRGNDILLLARHFLQSHGRRYGKPNLRFSPDAERQLLEYFWPGNVREMRNMLEQTVLLAPTDLISTTQLALCPSLAPESKFERDFRGCNEPCMSVPRGSGSTDMADLAEMERTLVVKTLERTGWNVTKSAKLLGLSRDMMRYRIEKMGLQRPVDQPGSGFGTLQEY